MQYISLEPTIIETSGAVHRLVPEAALGHWPEAPQPDGFRPVDFPSSVRAREFVRQGPYDEPVEDLLEDLQPYTGWKLFAIWTAVTAGSWALVIGCVMMIRRLLP